jgi:hypothetical protein
MSMEPIQRQMTNPAAGVVNTPALLQDTAVGPLRLAAGQLQMSGTPVGAAAPAGDQNIVIKFSNGF